MVNLAQTLLRRTDSIGYICCYSIVLMCYNVLQIGGRFNAANVLLAAVFPVELSTFFIKAFSNEGDVVLDIFGGSGTVAVSCIETNRDFIIIEKELENIELIKKRVEEKIKQKEF